MPLDEHLLGKDLVGYYANKAAMDATFDNLTLAFPNTLIFVGEFGIWNGVEHEYESVGFALTPCFTWELTFRVVCVGNFPDLHRLCHKSHQQAWLEACSLVSFSLRNYAHLAVCLLGDTPKGQWPILFRPS